MEPRLPGVDLSNNGSPFDPGLGCSRDPRLSLLQDSSAWVPETDKPYMCSSCGKGYTHIFTLNRHRRTVCGKIRNTNGKWKCPRCTRSYVTEGNLVRHVRFECGVRRKFCCIFCNRKFTQRCSLIRHLRNFHNESFDSATSAAGPDFQPMEPHHQAAKCSGMPGYEEQRQNSGEVGVLPDTTYPSRIRAKASSESEFR